MRRLPREATVDVSLADCQAAVAAINPSGEGGLSAEELRRYARQVTVNRPVALSPVPLQSVAAGTGVLVAPRAGDGDWVRCCTRGRSGLVRGSDLSAAPSALTLSLSDDLAVVAATGPLRRRVRCLKVSAKWRWVSTDGSAEPPPGDDELESLVRDGDVGSLGRLCSRYGLLSAAGDELRAYLQSGACEKLSATLRSFRADREPRIWWRSVNPSGVAGPAVECGRAGRGPARTSDYAAEGKELKRVGKGSSLELLISGSGQAVLHSATASFTIDDVAGSAGSISADIRTVTASPSAPLFPPPATAKDLVPVQRGQRGIAEAEVGGCARLRLPTGDAGWVPADAVTNAHFGSSALPVSVTGEARAGADAVEVCRTPPLPAGLASLAVAVRWVAPDGGRVVWRVAGGGGGGRDCGGSPPKQLSTAVRVWDADAVGAVAAGDSIVFSVTGAESADAHVECLRAQLSFVKRPLRELVGGRIGKMFEPVGAVRVTASDLYRLCSCRYRGGDASVRAAWCAVVSSAVSASPRMSPQAVVPVPPATRAAAAAGPHLRSRLEIDSQRLPCGGATHEPSRQRVWLRAGERCGAGVPPPLRGTWHAATPRPAAAAAEEEGPRQPLTARPPSKELLKGLRMRREKLLLHKGVAERVREQRMRAAAFEADTFKTEFLPESCAALRRREREGGAAGGDDDAACPLPELTDPTSRAAFSFRPAFSPAAGQPPFETKFKVPTNEELRLEAKRDAERWRRAEVRAPEAPAPPSIHDRPWNRDCTPAGRRETLAHAPFSSTLLNDGSGGVPPQDPHQDAKLRRAARRLRLAGVPCVREQEVASRARHPADWVDPA